MATKATQQEIIPPARYRDIWLTIAGVAVILALVNAVLYWRLGRFEMEGGTRVVVKKWEMLQQQKEPLDWLVLGDSSGISGFDPKILEEKMGGKARSFCVTAYSQTINTAWMLDHYIQRFGPPKGVVIMHVYDVWERTEEELDFLHSVSKMPCAWGEWERMQPPLPLNARAQFDVFLMRYMPIYADNDSVSKLVKFPWKIYESRRLLNANRDWSRETGLRPLKKADEAHVERDARWHVEKFIGDRTEFKLSDLSRRTLEHIGLLAEKHGFDVYLVDSPIYEGLMKEPRFTAYYSQVRRTLDEAVAAHGTRVRHLPAEPITYPKDKMQNCDHIVECEVKGFTERIIAEIQAARQSADRQASLTPEAQN